MFDPPERVPYSKIGISENDSIAHRQLAREAERKAIVLLRNQGGILPLSASVGKVAVIGPSADDPVALLGNYHGISSKQVTPLEGIQRQFTTAQVKYALGATYTASTPSLVPSTVLTTPDGNDHGVQVEYFNNPELQGQPKLSRTEPRVYFDLGMEDPAIIAAVGREKYSVRWTSTLTPKTTGEYRLNIRGGFGRAAAQVDVFLDGKKLDFGSAPAGQPTPAQLAPGARRVPQVTLQLEGGRKYDLRIEYKQPGAVGLPN
jgi:beta-glucosidase